MKIAILHSAFVESGGAERVVMKQAQGLQELGHQVTCYSAAIKRKNCFNGESAGLDLKAYIFNMALPKLKYSVPLSTSLMLAPLIAQRFKRFDVLLCHHEPAPWIAHQVFLKYGIPYICYMHHPPRFIYPREVEKDLGWGHNWDRKVIGFIERTTRVTRKLDFKAVSQAKAIMVNSKKIAEEIKGIYDVKPVVCYPGAELQGDGNLSIADNDEVLTKLGITTPFILTTARHTPHKRLEWLLEIYDKVIDELPGVTLVIVGAFHPTYTAKLQNLADSVVSGKVIFANYVSNQDLKSLYRQAAAYAFPAPNEDFGLGPVEAMICGVPVVCWDDGAGPSETVTDGVTGFKITPYNTDDFAQKIGWLLKDGALSQQLGNAARVYAETNFTWARHVSTLEQILESCQCEPAVNEVISEVL